MKMGNGCSEPGGPLGQTISLSKEVVLLQLVSKYDGGMSIFSNWRSLMEYVYTCYTYEDVGIFDASGYQQTGGFRLLGLCKLCLSSVS